MRPLSALALVGALAACGKSAPPDVAPAPADDVIAVPPPDVAVVAPTDAIPEPPADVVATPPADVVAAAACMDAWPLLESPRADARTLSFCAREGHGETLTCFRYDLETDALTRDAAGPHAPPAEAPPGPSDASFTVDDAAGTIRLCTDADHCKTLEAREAYGVSMSPDKKLLAVNSLGALFDVASARRVAVFEGRSDKRFLGPLEGAGFLAIAFLGPRVVLSLGGAPGPRYASLTDTTFAWVAPLGGPDFPNDVWEALPLGDDVVALTGLSANWLVIQDLRSGKVLHRVDVGAARKDRTLVEGDDGGQSNIQMLRLGGGDLIALHGGSDGGTIVRIDVAAGTVKKVYHLPVCPTPLPPLLPP
ncbi:MAG: hypothetical protein U1F43_22615 [Myxococcota bacterium]